MNRRRLLLGLAAGLALPAPMRAQSVPRPGGVVRVGLPALPERWDPLDAADFATHWISTLVYDTLLVMNEDGAIVPGLALFAGWSEDGTRLAIDLRPNARFADGALVTVADVVASLERVREQSWRLDSVVSITAVSDITVELRTARRDASLRPMLAAPDLAILPAGAPDVADQVAAGAFPAGSGPFRVLPLGDGDIRLRPNRYYWQMGRPHLGAIRIIPVEEESNRSVGLLTGSIDLLPDVPLLDVAVLRQNPALTLIGGPSVLGCMLQLNLLQSPLSDVAFRLLLNHAIDRKALVSAATTDEATPAHHLVPAGHWAALDDLQETLEPDAAQQQLRALGYPIGIRLRMISDERDVALSNAAVFLQDQLAFAGISLTADPLSDVALRRAIATGDFDIYATNIGAWRDPHELFRPLVATDGPRNIGGYASDQCDRLVQGGIQVEDTVRRAPYYQQLQRVLQQDVPFVVLYTQYSFDGMTTALREYAQYPPVSALGMRQAWLDE